MKGLITLYLKGDSSSCGQSQSFKTSPERCIFSVVCLRYCGTDTKGLITL